MSMIPMSMCGAFIGAGLGYAVETAAPKTGLGTADLIAARLRNDWATGTTTAWSGDHAAAAVETQLGADAFSAHQASRKPSRLPREVPCLT
jgi:hypothetical protein